MAQTDFEHAEHDHIDVFQVFPSESKNFYC